MPSSFFNACCGADEERTWDETALQQTEKAAPPGEEEETAVIAPMAANMSDQAENATLELQATEIKVEVEEAKTEEPKKEESPVDEPKMEEQGKKEINAEEPKADRVAPFNFSVKIPKDGSSKLGLMLVGTPSPKAQQIVKACRPGSLADMFNNKQPMEETFQVYDGVLQVNGRMAETVTEALKVADAAESVELVLSRPKKMEVDINRNGRKLGLLLDIDHDKDSLTGIVIKRVNENGLASDMPAGTFLPGDLIIAVNGELQRDNNELLKKLQGEQYTMTLLRFC